MSDGLTHCPCCEGEGYFYGDEKPSSPWGDAAELSRLRAEVERLTAERDAADRRTGAMRKCAASESAKAASLRIALADERRHADALAEALTTLIEGGNRQLALISRKVRVTDPMTLTVTKGQLLAAIEERAAHRARRQG